MRFESVLVISALAVSAAAIDGKRSNFDKGYYSSAWANETSITGPVSEPVPGWNPEKCYGTGGSPSEHTSSLERRYCNFGTNERCCTTSHDEFIEHMILWDKDKWPPLCKKEFKFQKAKEMYCMICDPEQPSWTVFEGRGNTDVRIVRVCESMLRSFYGHDNLDEPTDYFQRCGAWNDPDIYYTPVNGKNATDGYEENHPTPEVIFPEGSFADAKAFFDRRDGFV